MGRRRHKDVRSPYRPSQPTRDRGGAIGGAVARAFARAGAKVFLAGRTQAKLDAVAEQIRSVGGYADTALVDCAAWHNRAVDDRYSEAARCAPCDGRAALSEAAASRFVAVTAGRLYERERAVIREARERFPAAWAAASKPALTGWLPS